MKQAPSVALVGAGSVSRSFLARIPKLADQLGPVKAPSFRVARRIVNSLRFGYAVREHAELRDARLVLIAVPDSRAAATLEELGSAMSDWRDRSVVLCGSRQNSGLLAALAARGASVASLDPIPGMRQDHYAIAGDRAALSRLRSLLGDGAKRTIEIHPEAKEHFLRALWMASAGVMPAIDAAVMNLRHAGVERRVAVPIVEELVLKSVRGYLRAGRKARHAPRHWPGDFPARPCETEHVLRALAGQ